MRRLPDIGWIVLWGVLSSCWIVSASRELSATFDEPFYLRSSLKSWRTGSNFELMKAGTMPLAIDLEYLPVYLMEQLDGKPIDEKAEFHRILSIGRTGNLIFWWLLLIYGFRLADWYAGPWAGRLAVVLLATEPSFLGHACLATTDLSISATMLLFTYHYSVGRNQTGFRRWFIPGVLYGVALLAKASALTFVPLVMFALEVPRWWQSQIWKPSPIGIGRIRHLWNHVQPLWSDFWKIFAIGTVVLWGYCGCDWKELPSFVKWANTIQDETWGPRIRWTAEHLKIFPNAGQAIVYQIKHNIRGHGAFLFEEWYPRAVKHYFPAALTIKLTIPVLALFVLLLARPKNFATPLTLAALILFLFTFNVRVQIGIRLIFPFVAFFLVTIAVGLARWTVNWNDPRKWFLLVTLGGLLVYPPLRVWPDGLRYANELWGGPDRVHLLIGDSNSDWGQGLIDLDRWTEEQGLPLTRVWYYGMDPKIVPENEPPTERDYGRLFPFHHSRYYPLEKPEDAWPFVKGQVIAVGKTILWGDPAITPTMPIGLEFFRSQKPIGETRSFLIYDFRNP